MAQAKTIEIPDFDFSGVYYPDILRSLIQYQRTNVPEITDESDEEPFQQLLRSFALVGHLNNVLLDISANESLLPTARLLESVRGHLALIDVKLKQASPAQTDMVYELSKVFDTAIELIPENSQVATVETEESPQIIYETNESFVIEPSNVPTAIFQFTAGLIEIIDNNFDGNEIITLFGVQFRLGIEWAAGGTIPLSLTALANAINNSVDANIRGRVYALTDGVSKISVIPMVPEVESITIGLTDGATANFIVANGAFSSNKTGVASTDGVFWNLFPSTPKKGDTIYVMHTNVMWDALGFVFNTFGSGIKYAIEYFDNTLEDAKPNLVTNLGSNLELDLTDLLGTEDRSGTVIRVVLSSTGAQETLVTQYAAGVNKAFTSGLLGQSVVSLDEQDYIVGTLWNEVSDTDDGTTELSEDGQISFTLPQNQSQNWTTTTINGVLGYAIRIRVVEVTAPVNPSVDRLRIDTGKQFVMVPVVQGQTVADEPLGSSNGVENQPFLLTFKPIIEGTLLVEVDEGAGFQPWTQKENFLASNSASKHYTLDIQADDDATVEFGDGKQGKIPSPGVDNIRALYRIGADIDGNVGARTITVNKSGISFINRIFNPRQAIGWAAKEGSTDTDLARLKVEGPATLRTRGRAITTADFEFLATQFTDSNGSKLVARAKAIEETFGVKTVEVVVVGFAGTLLTELQREAITDFFNGNKEKEIEPSIVTNHEATIVNYTPKTIDVVATVTGGNQEEIKNAITALLNPEATFSDGVTKRWQFGQEVPLSVIVSTVFEVDPVNIKKVVLTSAQAIGEAIPLNTRELPFAGSVAVTVI